MDGREHYYFIVASAIIPLVGVVAAIVLLWNTAVGTSDMVASASCTSSLRSASPPGTTGCSRIVRSRRRGR